MLVTRTSCNAEIFHIVYQSKITREKYPYKLMSQGRLYFWFTYEPTGFVEY